MRGKPSFLAVDFFCGAGGTTNGLIAAGGYVFAGVDKEGECRRTFVENNLNPDGTNPAYLQRDIFKKTDDYPDGEQDILVEEIKALHSPLRSRYPGVPLLFSICAPCQPFTNMSRNVGEEREEGRRRDRGLLGQSLDIIRRFMPELVLCENVAGIQNKKYGGVWQSFMAEMEEDYLVGSAVVDAVNFGIPQYRKRSILLAVRKDVASAATREALDENGRLVVPEEDPDEPLRTVRETIGHLPPLEPGGVHPAIANHHCGKVKEVNRKRLAFIAPGGSNRDYIGTGLELACHVRLKEGAAGKQSGSGFSDSYTRLSGDRPAPTITTKCYSFTNGRYGHYDMSQQRALSVREAAALQSFPDSYEFHSKSLIRAARMVGNAVPPKLGCFFGRKLSTMYDSSAVSMAA